MRGHVSIAALVAAAVLAAPAGAATDPTALVDPFVGTAGGGGAFPGATVPFGMTQPSPDTPSPLGGGYDHRAKELYGFGTTHLSGPGCPALGDVVVAPYAAAPAGVDPRDHPQAFSHADETASPGYYAVTLGSGVRAELTATTRTAWERFSFPRKGGAVAIAPGAGERGADDAAVQVDGDRTVEGSATVRGYWDECTNTGANVYTVYFYARFDRAFALRAVTEHGPGAGALVSFARPDPVTVRIGISYVSVAGARRNLELESRGRAFDDVRVSARRRWASLLGRVRISGGTREQRVVFETALYHALLSPNVFSDEDGSYTGFDGLVHRSAAPHYTSFSLWDTYRSEQQLLDLVVPERVPAMTGSLLDDYEQFGWLPKWVYARYETNELVGDPAVPTLSDAYLKGLLPPGRRDEAWAAMVHNATALPHETSDFDGRIGLADYVNRGYVPYADRRKHRAAVSATLELGIADCALSLVARERGLDADADALARRSQGYRNLVGSSRLLPPRLQNGSFLPESKFDPDGTAGFAEGSSRQYTWLVPQDVPGLVAALGGGDPARSSLDALFATGRYTQGNEVDLQAPYLYDYLGLPERTHRQVDAELAVYRDAPDGLPGNDDLGELSSWYVLSALGLYPVFGGSDVYALTRPLFAHATVRVGRATLTIDGGGGGPFAGAELDGKPLPGPFVSDAALRRGARLSFGDARWPGGAPEPPPSPCSGVYPEPPATLAFANDSSFDTSHTHPGVPVEVSATAVVGAAPLAGVSLRLDLPPGWTAKPVSGGAPGPLLAPGSRVTATWDVFPPADARPAAYEVALYLTWAPPGTQPSPATSTLASQEIDVDP